MDPAVSNLGWTEDQWNRICSTVAEEAQRARVVAQALPCVGEDPNALAIPEYRLKSLVDKASPYAAERLTVDSNPKLFVTTISVNVPLRSHEVADPQLQAALVMFRRAANYIARIEDALLFNGRPGADKDPAGLTGIPPVFRISGDESANGLFDVKGNIPQSELGNAGDAVRDPAKDGNAVFDQIIAAIDALEGKGQTGPFACLLSHKLFQLVCDPNGNFVMARDRILPFLQGPLLRSSQIAKGGCVVALGGSPVELVVASDISVRFLQTTPEPRQVFRVSERVALRIKEPQAIAMLG